MVARVILIEDEDLLREGLKRALERKGYEVISFADPSFCPLFSCSGESCSDEQFYGDFLLTDNKMPHASGLDSIEMQMGKSFGAAPINRAVMSAYWDEAELARAQKLGCKIFHKPLNLKEIFTWLEQGKKALTPHSQQ